MNLADQLVEATQTVNTYYRHYMLDEAAGPEFCVCGEEQHSRALAVQDALSRLPALIEAVSALEAQACPSGVGVEAVQSIVFNRSVDLGDRLFALIAGEGKWSWDRYEVSKEIEGAIFDLLRLCPPQEQQPVSEEEALKLLNQQLSKEGLPRLASRLAYRALGSAGITLVRRRS